MPDRPPVVYDSRAREELMRELLRARGITSVTPVMVQVSTSMAGYGSGLIAAVGMDPGVLRFAAAEFALWTQTAEALAVYADELWTETGARTADQAAEFLREHRE